MSEQPFWKVKALDELSVEQWEALCDGCGRCCLEKLEDEDTGEIHYTNLSCRLLDTERCRCSDYPNRSAVVDTCMQLTAANVANCHWLPDSCAYRLLAAGKDLHWWHPLVSGTRASVHEAGISVRGKCMSEEYVNPEQFEDHVIRWVES